MLAFSAPLRSLATEVFYVKPVTEQEGSLCHIANHANSCVTLWFGFTAHVTKAEPAPSAPFAIENEYLRLYFDANGGIAGAFNKLDQLNISVTQDYL